MPPNSELRIVITTFPDEMAASALIRDLLRNRLIACGTLLPGCRSIYVWDDAPHDSEEVQVMLKTTDACLSELERCLHTAHPYMVPEFFVIQPESTSSAYGGWISEYCKSDSRTTITPHA